MKDVLDKLLEMRYKAILSEKLNNEQIMLILKDIKLLLDIKKEID